MKRTMFVRKSGHFVLVLSALLAFQGCRKEIVPEPETVRELPDIVLRAREWVREHEMLSHGRELELGTLDFLWEDYALGSNSHGQTIVSVPVRNPSDAKGGYMELAFGVDDAGDAQGMVKHYAGDMANGSVQLRLYTVTGEKAMSGTYHPATGRFGPILGLGKLVKIAKAKVDDEEKTLDGGTIEEVLVTAQSSSHDGGSGFGHWGSPGWGSFGGGGGSGGGDGGGGGIGFASGVGTSSNPISIEAVPVKAPRRRSGFVFPLLPFLLDGGSVVQPVPSPIRMSFAGGNAGFKSRVDSVLLGIKNGKFGNADYGCFAAGVLKAVQGKQGTSPLNIRLKPIRFGSNATYKPSTRTMEYIYADYIDAMSTFHELLHYYQDLSGYYPNMKNMGRNPSTGKASKGFANIEFEVRLILDIMKGYGSDYMYELKGSGLLTTEELGAIEGRYETFIESFRDSNKKLLNPSAMDMVRFMKEYDEFLNHYAAKSKNYRSEVDINMQPKALFELLRHVYNNCK